METCGVSVTEAEVRDRSGCDEEGTTPSGLSEAARQFGFSGTRSYSLRTDSVTALNELKDALARSLYPIVYLEFIPGTLHSVVVCNISEEGIDILDPMLGERRVTPTRFMEDWSAKGQVMILVER